MAIASSDNDQYGAEHHRLLVESHRTGDTDAFATIVRDHSRMLLAQRRLPDRLGQMASQVVLNPLAQVAYVAGAPTAPAARW